jgi:MGT family glycosyltransferase
MVVFFPEGAFGPTNNCVGIASRLKQRGYRVIFVVEESFAGTLEAKGFEERLMRLKPAPAQPEEPGQFWKDFIRDTAPHFRESTVEQLTTLMLPIWEELVSGATYVNERLAEIFEELEPDVIVQDNVVAFPAVLACGRPWVRIVSCNPLELRDPALPPTFSGYPTNDPSGREGFLREYRRLHQPLQREFNAFAQAHGCPPLPEDEFMYESPYLNLYLYPAEIDYPRSRRLPASFQRLDSCVRDTDPPFSVPEQLGREGALVYVSLGSLGSADGELMSRLVAMFAGTPHRVVMSLGPQEGQLKLPDNIYGAGFLPQPSVLPLADLVVTHGGNNTVTESLHFGKPMIVLPLFWDQHDNAQRVDELDLGVRLSPYSFTDQEFHAAVGKLLGGQGRRDLLVRMARRLQAAPGTQRAATLIAEVAESDRPLAEGAGG